MQRNLGLIVAAVAMALAAQPALLAGPDWVEETDAGRFPESAQYPVGEGALNTILGEINASAIASGTVDMEDMYAIFITDITGFTAKTFGAGSATFDTQLWLFDSDGLAILANDDFTVGFPPSGILSSATDGTGQTIPSRGLYFLAITGFDNDPTSTLGDALFTQTLRNEISGPDGPGGSQPIGGWGVSRESGTYLIALTGATFVPPDCDGDGIFDADDDDIDGDSIPNADDTCDYTPYDSRLLIILERGHPLLGSLPCDMDGDCDCDLDDYAKFQRLFSGIGCKNGLDVSTSGCPVGPE